MAGRAVAGMWAGAVVLLWAAMASSIVSSAAATEVLSKDALRRLGVVQYTFFLQEDPTTSYFVVPALEGHNGNFGAIVVIDQPVTLQPDRQSLQLGRGKGQATFSNIGETGGLEILWTITFNDIRPLGFGKSSLSFRGLNDLSLKVRELAIVGGTGKFRLAKGFALLSTYFRDPETRYATTNITAFVQLDPVYSLYSAEELIAAF